MSEFDYEIQYQGAFPMLSVLLKKGQKIKAQSGAMVAKTNHIELDSSMDGGLMRGLGRMLAGERMFFQTLTANKGEGIVMLAPDVPGDVSVLQVTPQKGYTIQKNGFFAASDGIDIKMKTQSVSKGLFSGEGFFILEAIGNGTLFLESFGAIHTLDLDPGEEITVDNGHLVAWESHLNYSIEKAASGWISSFTSGEGLVCRFKGPGKVLIQTRNQSAFAGWIFEMLPKK